MQEVAWQPESEAAGNRWSPKSAGKDGYGLAWLPDDKNVSFTYNSVLWTVPLT